MLFAEKLRELREKKGMSQKSLAESSGQPQQSIARWENGESVPAFDAVQSICKSLGVSCSAFDDCDYARVEKPRGRGRPAKGAEPEAKKPAGKPRKK